MNTYFNLWTTHLNHRDHGIHIAVHYQSTDSAESAKANGREPKTCLGRVFNYKLGCFEDVHKTRVCGCMTASIVENLAQVLSC
jgi:hypothetical protein